MNNITIPSPQHVPERFRRDCARILKRATEVKAVDPVICYWCCFHVLEMAWKIPHRTTEETTWMKDVFEVVEMMKAILGNNDAVLNGAASAAYVENFALNLYNRADATEKAGQVSADLAALFQAAADYLSLLGTADANGISDEMKARRRYAMLKRVSILKALAADDSTSAIIDHDDAAAPPAPPPSVVSTAAPPAPPPSVVSTAAPYRGSSSQPPRPSVPSGSTRRVSNSQQQRPVVSPPSSGDIQRSSSQQGGTPPSGHGSRRVSSSGGQRPMPIITLTSPTPAASTVSAATTAQTRAGPTPSEAWSTAASTGATAAERETWSTAATPGERDVEPWGNSAKVPKDESKRNGSPNSTSGLERKSSTKRQGSGDSSGSGGSGSSGGGLARNGSVKKHAKAGSTDTVTSTPRVDKPDHSDIPAKKTVQFMGPDGAPMSPASTFASISSVGEVAAPPSSEFGGQSEGHGGSRGRPVPLSSSGNSHSRAASQASNWSTKADAGYESEYRSASQASTWSTKAAPGTPKRESSPALPPPPVPSPTVPVPKTSRSSPPHASSPKASAPPPPTVPHTQVHHQAAQQPAPRPSVPVAAPVARPAASAAQIAYVGPVNPTQPHPTIQLTAAGKLPPRERNEVIKLIGYARSAMDYDDYKYARKELEKVLAMLPHENPSQM